MPSAAVFKNSDKNLSVAAGVILLKDSLLLSKMIKKKKKDHILEPGIWDAFIVLKKKKQAKKKLVAH